MAAKLSLDDYPHKADRSRSYCTDDRYVRWDNEMPRSPSPYLQRMAVPNYQARKDYQPRDYAQQDYQPRDYYIPRSQYHPREPPLIATPNTGFYNFVPDHQSRPPRLRSV